MLIVCVNVFSVDDIHDRLDQTARIHEVNADIAVITRWNVHKTSNTRHISWGAERHSPERNLQTNCRYGQSAYVEVFPCGELVTFIWNIHFSLKSVSIHKMFDKLEENYLKLTDRHRFPIYQFRFFNFKWMIIVITICSQLL